MEQKCSKNGAIKKDHSANLKRFLKLTLIKWDILALLWYLHIANTTKIVFLAQHVHLKSWIVGEVKNTVCLFSYCQDIFYSAVTSDKNSSLSNFLSYKL